MWVRKKQPIRALDLALELIDREDCLYTLIALLARPVGEWVSIRALCQSTGVDFRHFTDDLFVCWTRYLDAVDESDSDYVIFLFYDAASMGTSCATYNRRYLEERVLEANPTVH